MGKSLLIIRIFVAVIVIVALYAAGWYIFTRFDQLRDNNEYQTNQELNNPRINQGKIDSITKEFREREIYSDNQTPSVYVYEDDPFYTK